MRLDDAVPAATQPLPGPGGLPRPTSGTGEPGPARLPGRDGVPRPGDDPAMPSELTKPLEVALEAAWGEVLASDAAPTGAIAAIWRPGHHRWTGVVGVANPQTDAEYTTSTSFRIGSVTKTIVITALLRLADQGAVDLDAPISAWFPTDPTGSPAEVVVVDGDQITPRQLAGMTSGIANYTDDPSHGVDPVIRADPFTSWAPVQLGQAGLALPRNFPPGTAFGYSNTNTALVGLIIERATRQPLPRALDRLVLDPLGLDATAFVDTNHLPPPFARGYTAFTPSGAVAEATHWDPSWGWAAGQLVSTSDDMLTWAFQLGRGGLLSAKAFDERRQVAPVDDTTRYGLGVIEADGWWGHSGGINGYLTYVGYQPDLDVAMAISVNWGDTDDASGIVMRHLAPVIEELASPR